MSQSHFDYAPADLLAGWPAARFVTAEHVQHFFKAESSRITHICSLNLFLSVSAVCRTSLITESSVGVSMAGLDKMAAIRIAVIGAGYENTHDPNQVRATLFLANSFQDQVG